MDIFLNVLLLAVGLLLIIKGGDWFVDAASWIAEVSGIPTFIIGATIVSVATTLPEILVSIIAAAGGDVEIAIGNAVGSVNCNIALILAISLIFLPAKFKRKDYFNKAVLLLLAIALIWGFATGGTLNVWQSAIILFVFIIFIAENIYSAKKHSAHPITLADTIKVDEYNHVSRDMDFTLNANGTVSGKRKRKALEKKDVIKNIILFALGTAGIVLGAQSLVKSGTALAELAGVPQGIIGVTIIAVGTSLPELVTTITAIIKKKSELSVGNIIGANIIDMTLIMPLCAFVGGGSLPVSVQTLSIDLPFCIAFAAFTLIPALITGKFHRWQGFMLLGGYIAYLTVLILSM